MTILRQHATVTVKSGATVSGAIDLGSGADTLIFAGGTFSNVTEMQGGDGTDTLKFSGGSGRLHTTVVSDGLKGWESVVVESGAQISGNIKLDGTSSNLTFRNVTLDASGNLDGGAGDDTLSFIGVTAALTGNVSNWKTVNIGAGSTLSFGSNIHTLSADVSLTGTLNVGKDTDTTDTLTVAGDLAGGGTITLNTEFTPGQSTNTDKLVINKDKTGATTTIAITPLGSNLTANNIPERINSVIEVKGTVANPTQAFTVSGAVIGAFRYVLEYQSGTKRYDLRREYNNNCKSTGNGVFTCSGPNQIGASQSLSATGATALSVTLNSETPIGTTGTAFVLTQTGGSGGIIFTQSATGQSVSGAQGGIVASNAGGGAISIDVNGMVTGTGGDGISAANDASGSGVTITAASVTGANSGIEVVGSGTGAVKILATGPVTGTSKAGIDALASSAGAISITAAAVTGGAVGVKALSSGTGTISVKATGTVTGTSTAGVQATGGTTTGTMTINVATVTGKTGIEAKQGSANKLDISASGMVRGTGASGVGIDALASSAGALSITAAAVTGSAIGVKAVSSGAGTISVKATGAVIGTGTAGVQVSGGTTTGVIAINVATVTGKTGIEARQGSANALNVTATGLVTGTGTNGAGIDALASSAGALIITAAAVTGSAHGIKAVGSGAGAVSVNATGEVRGTGASGQGVYARATAAASLSVDVATVTGSAVGIKAVGSGSGDVTVDAGTVMATGASGIGIDASAAGGDVTISAAAVTGSGSGINVAATGAGNVSISATGAVKGTGNDGIFVDHDGDGATTVTVTTAVTGGTGANVAAIRTDAQSNSSVTILLNNGAAVGTTTAGTANAIIGSAGNTSVTVNTGASIAGKVKLGGGTDTLTFLGGTFSNITEFDGGAGAGDTLTFSKGDTASLHATVVSTGLKGWESVIVESGATISGGITLAADSGNLTFENTNITNITALTGGAGTANTLSFNKVSGSFVGKTVAGWETVVIGAGSEIRLADGSHTLAGGLTVAAGGTLDLGKDTDTTDALTVSGDFTGGGTITLNANFLPNAGASDTLTISGDATGATTLVFTAIAGNLGNNQTNSQRPQTISGVVTVTGTVAAGAFTSSVINFGSVAYRLKARSDNAKVFDLARTFTNKCEPTTTAGVFTCSGTDQIGASQPLGSSGTTALSVTLNSETAVDAEQTAFTLTQTGGAGGITFTQSATGQTIKGAMSAIAANNSGGGAIAIDVNGAVTGAAGDGISATNDASGSGITITAASVSGANSGIKAIEDGTGAVTIVATGTVTGTSREGIYAKTAASGGAVTVTAAAVTGGDYGIKAESHSGISITQTGTGEIKSSNAGKNFSGVSAKNSGGSILINVTGTVSQIARYNYASGIYAKNAGSTTGDLTISTGDTVGPQAGILAINEGTGVLDITVIGSAKGVRSYANDFAAIIARSSGSGGIFITMKKRPGAADDAISIDAAAMGIRAFNTGTGPTSITVEGEIVGPTSKRSAIFVDAAASSGDITISLRDRVVTGDGISVIHRGTGNVSITVGEMRGIQSGGTLFYADGGIHAQTKGDFFITASGHVDGGSFDPNQQDGLSEMSIWTRSTASSSVTVTLNSGAVIDEGIRDQAGNASVTVHAGATVHGSVRLEEGNDWVDVVGGTISANIDLGSGTDTLRVASGTASGSVDLGTGDDRIEVEGGSLSGTLDAGAGVDTLTFAGGTFGWVTEFDGGAGVDTLRFSAGSGSLHATVVSEGLKGWESVRRGERRDDQRGNHAGGRFQQPDA